MWREHERSWDTGTEENSEVRKELDMKGKDWKDTVLTERER